MHTWQHWQIVFPVHLSHTHACSMQQASQMLVHYKSLRPQLAFSELELCATGSHFKYA